jgi:hypothetical protein
MKSLVIVLTSSLLLFSCNKNKTTIIEGILMASCDTPAANTSGTIKTDDGFGVQGESLSFTTDENGYFKVSYTGNKNIDKFRVIAGGGEVLSVWNLPGREKDLGKVYINPFPTNFIIKLDVRNPYTENDTLVIKDFSSSNPLAQRKIAGPFESGTLEIVENQPYNLFPIHYSQTINGNNPKYAILFHMLPFVGDIDRVDFDIAPICSGEFAEVTLVID